VSSLRRNGKQFANAVRNHWSIENTLHWSLDMTYREDESRVPGKMYFTVRSPPTGVHPELVLATSLHVEPDQATPKQGQQHHEASHGWLER
jgi:hypothetical protein